MATIQKVTDPLKQVTDPVLLSALAKQGIDKDYVELSQDYALPVAGEKGKSPYAKFYRDLQSNKRFMVVSGLPMVDADGVKVEARWIALGRDSFAEKNNLFNASVVGNETTIVVRNDQPGGVRAGARLSFRPQLFMGGVEQACGKPTLLAVDPVNENYQENTVEWDYGVCRRRVRLIEGRFLGSWVFTSAPKGDVLIKYNQSGKLRLRLQYAKDYDTELIPKTFFDEAKEYPVTISDSATFYPDASPETSSVDGYVSTNTGGLTWSSIVAEPGSSAGDSAASIYVVRIIADSASHWQGLYRGIFLFDTSSLPDAVNISAATISLYGSAKYDGLVATPNLNIYSSAPATNTALVAGDFDSLGATAFCNTPITYAGFGTSGYNDFTLNASGIAAVSKTGVSKFGVRNANYDVANTAPPWVAYEDSRLYVYCAEQGEGYQPKLSVTYTVGGGLFYQDVGGALTSASSLNRMTCKSPGAGAVGLASAVNKLVSKAVGAGSVGSASTLARKMLVGMGSGAVGLASTLGRKVNVTVGGAVTTASSLGRAIFIAVGSGSVGLASTLGRLIAKGVGAGAVGLSSILSAIVIGAGLFFQSVGGGAVTMSGALGRLVKVTIGSGAVTISGSLGRLIKISVGGGAVSMAGVVTTAEVLARKLTLWLRSVLFHVKQRSVQLSLQSRSLSLTLPGR